MPALCTINVRTSLVTTNNFWFTSHIVVNVIHRSTCQMRGKTKTIQMENLSKMINEMKKNLTSTFILTVSLTFCLTNKTITQIVYLILTCKFFRRIRPHCWHNQWRSMWPHSPNSLALCIPANRWQNNKCNIYKKKMKRRKLCTLLSGAALSAMVNKTRILSPALPAKSRQRPCWNLP